MAQTDDEPDVVDTDVARLQRIWTRYHRQMEILDFADPATRAQLAFDLGFLIGLAHRAIGREEAD